MASKLGRKLASVITAVVFGFVLWKLLERTFIVIWSNTPWWGLLILLVVLFLLIDYMVNRIFKS